MVYVHAWHGSVPPDMCMLANTLQPAVEHVSMNVQALHTEQGPHCAIAVTDASSWMEHKRCSDLAGNALHCR